MSTALLRLDHLSHQFSSGLLRLLNTGIASRLLDALYLERWNEVGTTLDWPNVAHKGIMFNAMIPLNASDAVKSTRFEEQRELIFTFGGSGIAVLAPIMEGLNMTKDVYWRWPGRQYLFGANHLNDKDLANIPLCFAEYDGADRLRIVCS